MSSPFPMAWGPTRNAGGHFDAPITFIEDFTHYSIENDLTGIVTLTDAGDGTGNDVLEALTDPTDAPASADVLREDLVAVHWPILRNNVADLRDKIVEMLAEISPATFGSTASSDWLCTLTGTGDTNIGDRIGKIDVDGGAVRFTCGDAANDYTNAALANDSFLFALDRKMSFETRIRIPSDFAGQRVFIGMCPNSFTAAVGSFVGSALDDCMGFSFNASAALNVGGEALNATVVSTGKSLVANTWHKLGVHWDGKQGIKFVLDGKLVANLADSDNLPSGSALVSPVISTRAVSTSQATLDVDYVMVICERG